MSIRTNYEKWYGREDYYWGLEPGHFLEELIELCPPSSGKKILDIGCGEGKDAVYMAQKGYDVTAFDLTGNGIRKTEALAGKRGVKINAYVDDINTFSTDEKFDIIYSTGTVQYLFEENKKGFFEKLDRITKKTGSFTSTYLWKNLSSNCRPTGIRKRKCGSPVSCSPISPTGRPSA